MLDARHDLLPHVTALLEIHAMQAVEIRLMHNRVAIGKIHPAARHTKRDAVYFIGRYIGLNCQLCDNVGWRNRPPAELCLTRINKRVRQVRGIAKSG